MNLPADTVAVLAIVSFLGSFLGALVAPRLHVSAIVSIVDRRLRVLGCSRLPPSREPITAPVHK